VRWLAILSVCALVSCSGSKETFHVRQFHLRALKPETAGVDSIRAEIQKRFHGAVSEEEKRNRLGHYYTIKWDGPEGREKEAVRLVFQYRQAATGSKVHQMEVRAPAGRKGYRELQLIGPAYLEGGRVLAWHMSFYRGTELIDTRQSYLWE
jgi:hypothetical protein